MYDINDGSLYKIKLKININYLFNPFQRDVNLSNNIKKLAATGL